LINTAFTHTCCHNRVCPPLPSRVARGVMAQSNVPVILGILIITSATSTTHALDNGLGLTPPMGYNAYDHVGCCANETTMKEQGQALIDRGLFALGYKYVNMVGHQHATLVCQRCLH
jgi:hypothetical protein